MSTKTLPNRLEVERELIMRRCKADPAYFIFKYIKVNRVGEGYGEFTPWDHQPEIVGWLDSQHHTGGDRSLALKARQIGWTTIASAYALWSMLFHDHYPWLIASQGELEATDTLATKIVNPYSMLPAWMRKRLPKVIKDNEGRFNFDNGSGVLSIPATSKAGRSKAVFGVILDEAAFVDGAEDLFAALDPMCYGPMFVFSTANGMGNWFHERWLESQQDDSAWDSKFYPWSCVPTRDQGWYDGKLLKYRGKEHLFYQEYPATATEAFLKSGRTAWNIEELEANHDWSHPLFKLDLALINTQDASSIERATFDTAETRDLEMWVYEPPTIERYDDGRLKREPNYVIGVDVAEGLEHGDYSSIVVRNVHTSQQVATVKSHIPIFTLGAIVEAVGYWYHTALVGVERNAVGLVPLQYLTQFGYPRLYRQEQFAQIKIGDRTSRYGWHTNNSTKPKMIQDFAADLAAKAVHLHDRRFLIESTTFISNGRGGYAASPPNHDDLVMAELITHQMQLDIGRYPVIWYDPAPGPLTMGALFGLETLQSAVGTALSKTVGHRPEERSVVRSFEIRR